ncbi:MAG TPA: hypothetical protein VF142_20405 [Longimicrobium sp.]
MIATAEMFIARAIPGRPTLPHERRAQSVPVEPRRRVTPGELVQVINRQVTGQSDCEGLVIEAGVLRLPLPDPDGCNWSPCGLHVRVAHGSSTRALGCVRQVVEWARLNFELAEPAA